MYIVYIYIYIYTIYIKYTYLYNYVYILYILYIYIYISYSSLLCVGVVWLLCVTLSHRCDYFPGGCQGVPSGW